MFSVNVGASIMYEDLQSVAELLTVDVGSALNLAFGGFKDSGGGFDSVEVSVLLCNDEFIRKRNKEWGDEDRATGVVSKSRHVPDLKVSNVRTCICVFTIFRGFMFDSNFVTDIGLLVLIAGCVG